MNYRNGFPKHDTNPRKQIWQRFLHPLLDFKRPEQGDLEFLSYLFHVNSRTITLYTVNEEFYIPGLLEVTPSHRTTRCTKKKRLVKTQYKLWVRRDLIDNTIDVEVEPPMRAGKIFRLTPTQWLGIVGKVRKVK